MTRAALFQILRDHHVSIDQPLVDAVDGWCGANGVPKDGAGIASGAGNVGAGGNVPPAGALRPSVGAFSIIKEFEGYARALPDGGCKAYPDPGSGGDPWTIGFGSTGPDVKPGTVWTRQQAEARLEADVIRFAAKVAGLIDAGSPTTQNQFDAMVSLAYNVGEGNFAKSSVLREHRAGHYSLAQGHFADWNKAAGHVMAGLTRRRAAEAALYAS